LPKGEEKMKSFQVANRDSKREKCVVSEQKKKKKKRGYKKPFFCGEGKKGRVGVTLSGPGIDAPPPGIVLPAMKTGGGGRLSCNPFKGKKRKKKL